MSQLPGTPDRTLSYARSDMQPQGMTALAGTFFGSIGLMVVAIVVMFAGISARDDNMAIGGGLLLIPAFIMEIVAVVLLMIKLYRGWKIIQPLRRLDATEAGMPTPGTAVGFLFIPFFNFYWIFVAYRSLATRSNKFIQLTGRSAAPISEGLGTGLCVCTLLGIVPLLNYLMMLITPFVMYAFISQVNQTTNDLISNP